MRFKTAFSLLFVGLAFQQTTLARSIHELPFEFRNGLIWVRLQSSGHLLNFVLDSGAGTSVLNLQTARQMGVKIGDAQTVQAVQSRTTAYRVSHFAASLCGIPLTSDPLAVNLDAASQSCGRRIDGLAGQDFFRNHIVQIDYKTHCIRILEEAEPARCCANLPLQFRNDTMCVPLSVNGSKPLWTRLDTGCDDGLHWVVGALKFREICKSSIGFSRSTGNSVYVNVQLGNEAINGVKATLHQTGIFSGEAGLLGNAILSKYNVTIDAISRRVFFEKR